jgi:hypothetical protein
MTILLFMTKTYRYFYNREFPGCPSSNVDACSQYDGNAILETQDVAVNDYSALDTWGAVVLIGAIYYTVAAVNLCYLKFPVSGSVGDFGGDLPQDNLLSDPDCVDTDNPMISTPAAAIATIRTLSDDRTLSKEDVEQETFSDRVVISVERVSIFVHTSSSNMPTVRRDQDLYTGDTTQPSLLGRKEILRNVCSEMHPARLTALMGSSGSG